MSGVGMIYKATHTQAHPSQTFNKIMSTNAKTFFAGSSDINTSLTLQGHSL